MLLESGQFAECERTLDHLRQKNPDFQSQDGHLIYARALEGQDKIEEATREYEPFPDTWQVSRPRRAMVCS